MKILIMMVVSWVAITTSAMTGGELSTSKEFAAVVRFASCSGVFIHPRLIVTAAHCIPLIRSLRLDIYKNSRSGEHFEVFIQKSFAHPDYGDRYFDRDIGFILLAEPVDDKTILENLPVLAEPPASGEKIIAVGIGTKSETRLSFHSMSEEYKKRVNYILTKVQGSLLTMSQEKIGFSQCRGDSGGALFTVRENGKFNLVGLITARNDVSCGDPNLIAYGEAALFWKSWLEKETGLTLP